MQSRFALLLLLGLWSSTAVAAPAHPDPQPLLDRLHRLIGSAACISDDECRTLPLGILPCGGPERYLAWSIRVTRPAELEAAAAAYTRARQKQIEREGLSSLCVIVEDPGATCRKQPDARHGNCVTSPNGRTRIPR